MALSHEHVELKILAEIEIYIHIRAELLCPLCYEIPCSCSIFKNITYENIYYFIWFVDRYIDLALNTLLHSDLDP